MLTEQLEDALTALSERRLELLYTYQMDGRYNCNSCGALGSIDYISDDKTSLKFEPHSPSCPIGNLLSHAEDLTFDD